MVLYEVDKSIVILDIGAAYTKFGFSGEYAPRAIIRTEVFCKRTKTTRKIQEYKDAQDLYDLLVDFIELIYFKYGLVSPKEKPIVIVESLLCPTIFRETLVKVLFKHYELGMVFMVPSHLVSLASLAIDTALVVDVGYTEGVVIPVCYGVLVIHAWQALPLGAQAIHSHLRTLLSSDNTGVSKLSEEVIEDIKVRCCFVTKQDRSRQLSAAKPEITPCPDIKYPLQGTDELKISGKVREKLYDIIYEEDNDHLSLSTMILDAIMKLNVDLRPIMAENILLIGGTTMAPGFKSRLKEELLTQLKSDRYKALKITTFKFHAAPSKENYTAWLGGSIYGATEMMNTKGLSKENYLKENRLPDWVIIKDSRTI